MEFMEAEAKSSLDRSAADIERWNSELKRIEGLVRDRVVDSQTLDETRKQAKSALANKGEIDAKIASAQAAVREARARQGRADADTLTAEAKKKVAAAEVERLQSLLSYTEIRAPFSGIEAMRNVHTGHFLQPGDAKAMPLFTICSRASAARACVNCGKRI